MQLTTRLDHAAVAGIPSIRAACGFSHGAAEVDTVPSRSHLLRKLLSNDVAAETSATLQCIRFVVSSGFEPPAPPPLAAGAPAAAAARGGE